MRLRNPLLGSGRRDQLQVAIVINELATPGLGSWIAGYRVAGAGQLILACAGFALFVVHLILQVSALLRAAEFGTEPVQPPAAWWHYALILFGIAWLWASVTSIQMYRELRTRKETSLPPRLTQEMAMPRDSHPPASAHR
jgi:hypothetical protein